MTTAISTVHQVELDLPVGNRPLAQLSVAPGKYLVTAVCSMQVSSADSDVIFTVALSLGNYFQPVRGLLRPSTDIQVAAVTLGAEVQRRSMIRLSATTNTPSAVVKAMNPSISAVRVDNLYFNRMPRTLGEILSVVVELMRR